MWRGKLLKMLQELTSSRKSDPVLGFNLPKNDYGKIREMIESNLTHLPHEIGYIPGKIDKGPDNDNAGKVMDFDDVLLEANSDKIRECKVIGVPGLGGGESSKVIARTLLDFKRIFPGSLVYVPKDEGAGRENRYIEGLGYYSNEGHINRLESESFFEKIIAPKITNENGKLLEPEKINKFTLLGFSIGSREIKSHVNYLSDHLISQGVERGDLQRYFNRVMVLNIGSPINWSDHFRALYLPSPNIINVLSSTDMGSRKPDELMRAVFLNPASHVEGEVTKFLRPFMNPKKEGLVVLGGGVVSNGKMIKEGVFVPNKLGHNLSNYVDAITSHEDAKGILNFVQSFVDEKVSDNELQKQFEGFFDKSIKYEYDKKLDEEDVKVLLESWQRYYLREVSAENDLSLSNKLRNFVNRTLQPAEIPPSSICAVGPAVNLEKKEKDLGEGKSG